VRRAGKAIWFVAGAVFLCPSVTWAQARTRYEFTSPGLRGLSNVGGRFALESTGLGSLRRSSAGGGGDLLRRSLSAPSYTLRRSTGGTGGGIATTPLPSAGTLTGMRYGTGGSSARSLADLTGVPQRPNLALDAIGNLDAYLVALGHTLETAREKGEAITSFVPAESSRYRDLMLAADKAFRQGKYYQAGDELEVAMALASDAPELHLDLVMTNVASGRYYSAVFHLRKALTVFPELPLVKMDLRDFYGKAAAEEGKPAPPSDFQEHRKALARQIERSGTRGESWLLLAAYMDYFSGSEERVPATLRKAYLKARTHGDKATIKAVSIFWDGMAAAGKVTGKLDPSAPDEGVVAASQPARAAGSDRTPAPGIRRPGSPKDSPAP